jgi:hypothetical protein
MQLCVYQVSVSDPFCPERFVDAAWLISITRGVIGQVAMQPLSRVTYTTKVSTQHQPSTSQTVIPLRDDDITRTLYDNRSRA